MKKIIETIEIEKINNAEMLYNWLNDSGFIRNYLKTLWSQRTVLVIQS